MSNDDDLSPQDQETLGRILAAFEEAFTASDRTLEAWAFYWEEATTVIDLGDNPISSAIDVIEQSAIAVLSELVDEIPDDCKPNAARAWAHSPEAMADVLKVIIPMDSEEELGASMFMTAVAALAYTGELRHAMKAGNLDRAVWAMRQATHLQGLMWSFTKEPFYEVGLRELSRKERGRDKILRGKNEMHLRWRELQLEIMDEYPKWKPMRVAAAVVKRYVDKDTGKPPKKPHSAKQVRKILHRFETNKPADS